MREGRDILYYVTVLGFWLNTNVIRVMSSSYVLNFYEYEIIIRMFYYSSFYIFSKYKMQNVDIEEKYA